MRILHAFYLLLLASSAGTFAQEKISATKIDAKHLPAGIAYEGKVKSATRWTDANGDNIIIATELTTSLNLQSTKFEIFLLLQFTNHIISCLIHLKATRNIIAIFELFHVYRFDYISTFG